MVRRCPTAGFTVTTLAAMGDRPGNRRALYELNRQCAADIPGRGPFYSFHEYVQELLDVPTFIPDGVVVALCGGRGSACPPRPTTVRPGTCSTR